MKRDSQKGKLYAWENKFISPLDRTNAQFDNLQAIVDYVWADIGMEYPPQVHKLAKHNKTCWANATRMKIGVQAAGCPTWVLLHEMAHSLTSDFEGHSHHHGAKFVGRYVDLVCRYIPSANKLLLLASLKAHKIEVKI